MKNDKLHLTVYTRQGTLIDTDVVNISAFNEKGPFDVLREHSRFISIIKDRLIVRLFGGEIKQIPVDNAIMRVRENRVEIYLGIKH